MDHSVSIEALKNELEETNKEASFLANGIMSMTARRLASQRIREDAILRWQSKLSVQSDRLSALQASITFLELHHTGEK